MSDLHHHNPSMGLGKVEIILVVLLSTFYITIRFLDFSPIMIAVVGFILALWMIVKPTEWAVEGLTLMAERIGIGSYAAGVLGMMMAFLPELILATLLIVRGQANIGILTVLIVAGANTLLFGVVTVSLSISKGGKIKVPLTTLRYESELMIVAFLTGIFLLVFNLAEGLTGKLVVDDAGQTSLKIPVLYSVGTVAIYIAYLVFIALDKELQPNVPDEERAMLKKQSRLQWGTILRFLGLGLIGIGIAGELLANGAEILIHEAETSGLELNEAQIAIIVGFLGSLPEWGVAIKAQENVELVFGNVLSSISATLLLMIGLVSIFLYLIGTPFRLDSYAIVQVVLSGSILLFVNLLMKDDLQLDAFEGVCIIILQLIGFDVLLSV